MAEKSVALQLARSLNSLPEAQNIMRAGFGVFSLQHPWAISVALLLARIITRASIDFFRRRWIFTYSGANVGV
jgi:hypothetical protein